MHYRFRPMTPSACQAISAWRYAAPYDFYDLDADAEDLAAFCDEQNWPGTHFSVHDAGGDLVGYFTYERKNACAVIGLAMRPDLTGQGLGTTFVAAGLGHGAEHLDIDQCELRVAEFNTRAVNVYRRLGFRITEKYLQATNGGTHPFLRMRGRAIRRGASIIMADSHRRVAMQLRDNKPNVGSADCWGLFGGMIEPGERPLDTIIREMKEELGIDLDARRLSLVKRLLSPTGIRSHVFFYPLAGELENADLQEGQRFDLVGPTDIREGRLQGKTVIPHQLDLLREFWAGRIQQSQTPG